MSLMGMWNVVELCCDPALACLALIPHRERWKVSFNRGLGKKPTPESCSLEKTRTSLRYLKASLVRLF